MTSKGKEGRKGPFVFLPRGKRNDRRHPKRKESKEILEKRKDSNALSESSLFARIKTRLTCRTCISSNDARTKFTAHLLDVCEHIDGKPF